MKKFRDSIPGAIIILSVTCLVVVLALAGTNFITAPLIAEAKEAASAQARLTVLPSADVLVPVTGDFSDKILDAYQAENQTGYVFEIADSGFKGKMTFMVGINAKGEYTGVTVVTHDETPGLGSKVADKDYLSRFVGLSQPDAVDNVTSATVTSGALKRALRSATAAYELLEGQQLPDATTEATGETIVNEDTDTVEESAVDEDTGATEATEEASEQEESHG